MRDELTEARRRQAAGEFLTHRQRQLLWEAERAEKPGLTIEPIAMGERGALIRIRFPEAQGLTDAQIREASRVIFDTVQVQTATVFGRLGQPMVKRFADLTPSEQEQAFRGLKDRIQREGLDGYIRRKRSAWGDRATDAVLGALKARRLLPGSNPKKLLTRDDVRVEVWEERDRLHIGIQDEETEEYVVSWWDDEARQMFEDGFFKRGPGLKESVLDYAETVGLLRR